MNYIIYQFYTTKYICILVSLLHASLNVSLTHDAAKPGVPLPPPLLLLFGNSQMKNMVASHST